MANAHSLALLAAAIVHRNLVGFKPAERPRVGQVPKGHPLERQIEKMLGDVPVGHVVATTRDPRLDGAKTGGRDGRPGLPEIVDAMDALIEAGESKNSAATVVSRVIANYLKKQGIETPPEWIDPENLRREYYRFQKKN